MAELKRYQMLIDGDWVDGEGGKSFESVNPATGAPWAEIQPESIIRRRNNSPSPYPSPKGEGTLRCLLA